MSSRFSQYILIAMALGPVMVNLPQPGANFPGTLPDKAQSTGLPVPAFSIAKFLTHSIPTSKADAMAQNEIPQIVVFAVFLAVAPGAMPERTRPIRGPIDDLAHILLYGLIARHKTQDKFKVTGEYLSYDPDGIMFRKGEPQLAAVVERTFRKPGSNRDLIPLYNKWFVARLPTGEKLGVSISPQLEQAFKVLDDTATK